MEELDIKSGPYSNEGAYPRSSSITTSPQSSQILLQTVSFVTKMAVTRASLEVKDVESVPHEKDSVIHKEYQRTGMTQDDFDFLDNFPEDRKKKVIRKVDVRFSSP